MASSVQGGVERADAVMKNWREVATVRRRGSAPIGVESP